MSGPDHLLLILHIGFSIFTIGPLTVATSATPRYIRRGEISVLRYLRRTTHLYAFGSIGVFLFGVFLAHGHFAKIWLTASMTLFIVAIVLLFIVERDQGRAIRALEAVAADAQAAPEAPAVAAPAAEDDAQPAAKDKDKEPAAPPFRPASVTLTAEQSAIVAQVERGRIASVSGVIALLWLVILVLMVWH